VPDRKVVIVDDEADVRLPLRRFLLGKGYAVLEADSVASVRASWARSPWTRPSWTSPCPTATASTSCAA
jgi:DNA-binding NtrC family response regulator